MNDPHVVALIYRVKHGKSVDYEDASPLSYDDDPRFQLTVEDNCARFELKEHYEDVGAARDALEPFIQHWEFQSAMRDGPGRFGLRFKEAEIEDRNPSPPEPRKKGFGASAVPSVLNVGGSAVLPGLTATGGVPFGSPRYPSPPAGGSVDPNDPDVKSMYDRYVNYCSGGEFLPGMVYFCLTMLEYKFRGKKGKKARDEAAAKYRIHKKVLCKIGNLSEKGGPIGRKGGTVSLTEREKRWLGESVKKIIYRAAQVAADDSQHLPQITMADLPRL